MMPSRRSAALISTIEIECGLVCPGMWIGKVARSSSGVHRPLACNTAGLLGSANQASRTEDHESESSIRPPYEEVVLFLRPMEASGMAGRPGRWVILPAASRRQAEATYGA